LTPGATGSTRDTSTGGGAGLSAFDHGLRDVTRKTHETSQLLLQRFVDAHGTRLCALIRERFVPPATPATPAAAAATANSDSKSSDSAAAEDEKRYRQFNGIAANINRVLKRILEIECELAELFPAGAGPIAGHKPTSSISELSLFKDSKAGKMLLNSTAPVGTSGAKGAAAGRDIEQMFKEKVKIVAPTGTLKPNRSSLLFAIIKVSHSAPHVGVRPLVAHLSLFAVIQMVLKAMIEHVRVSTFTRPAFVQLQVETHALRREWAEGGTAAADEPADAKTLHYLLEEILLSGADRCVESNSLLHTAELDKLLSQ
jgi:hypothetical protein